jgi:hypothetical protein
MCAQVFVNGSLIVVFFKFEYIISNIDILNMNQELEFVIACKQGNMTEIFSLLSKGYVYYEACLLGACEGGQHKIIQLMLLLEPDLQSAISSGFKLACRHGHVEIAEGLLNKLQPIDESHLKYACKHNSDVAIMMLEYFTVLEVLKMASIYKNISLVEHLTKIMDIRAMITQACIHKNAWLLCYIIATSKIEYNEIMSIASKQNNFMFVYMCLGIGANNYDEAISYTNDRLIKGLIIDTKRKASK